MPSSEDDSKESKTEGAKILDIRDRLPPVVFGDNPSGRMATKLLKVLTADDGQPYEHIAALMMVSHTLQRILKDGFGTSEEEMQYIRERAYEITENIHITINFKKDPK